MSAPVLRIEKLTKRFGGLVAIDDLSVAFEAGRLHAIIGPNGAGKTTLFNLITGILQADRGAIFFEYRDITRLKPHAISRLGLARTLQIKSVFTGLTVRENLWIAVQSRSRFLHPFRRASADSETARRVDEILEEIQLTEFANQPAGTLSYGDVALLEIGIALATRPNLLLLDEPVCGMSPAETERTVAKIKALSTSITVIIIEHDMEVVFGIANDITVLAQGRMLSRGTPDMIARDERVREAYLGCDEADHGA